MSVKDKESKDKADEFQKHVMIVYNNLDCPESLGVTVDGLFVPNQQVPEDHQCILHTFYKRDKGGIIIFTKHFSKFNLYCVKHADKSAYNAYLLAVLYKRITFAENKAFVDLKVVLDIQSNAKMVCVN